MTVFSMQFWIIVQTLINLLLLGVVGFIVLKRKKKSGIPHKPANESGREPAQDAAEKIIDLLEPLLRDAHAAARTFEKQINEKQVAIRRLNDTLDARIASLHLLLNRTDAYFPASGAAGPADNNRISALSIKDDIYAQQQKILELYQQGNDAESIAKKLSMPKGEVDLVLELKQKFVRMAENV